MTSRHLVDPELLPLIEQGDRPEMSAQSLESIRTGVEMIFDRLPEPASLEWRSVPGRAGAPAVDLLVVRPAIIGPASPALLYIHGGGMVAGSARAFRHQTAALAEAHGALVVSVDYRLAPEYPFPAAQEDCYAALEWMVENAAQLGVDPARILVLGESAGGGLAASVAQMARDRDQLAICGQALIYPMLDCRTGSAEAIQRNPAAGEFLWTAQENQFGWAALRGDYSPIDERRGWFSASLASSLAGLPPAIILTGALDLFVDENIDYARRLLADFVPTELHVYPGAIHGFTMLPQSRIAQVMQRDLKAWIERMIMRPL